MNFLHKSIYFLFVLSLSIMIASCHSQFANKVRKVTYPPDFIYTEQGDLRTEMTQLAQQMLLLDRALVTSPESTVLASEAQRQAVLNSLREMERIASRLKAGNAGANHPFMEDFMQEFIAKVDKARGAASIEPPRYYYAGKVSGGCTNCHKVNR